ncbi:MAG: hypothetical protein ACFFD9_01365 [Candidatus Thorarchaeota archaeon]
MSRTLTECTPQCKMFKCSRQPSAFKIRRKGSKKMVWCAEVDDECDGPWCKFGICTKRKMTEAGKCKGLERIPVVSVDDADFADVIREDLGNGDPEEYSKHLGGRRALD